MAATAKDYTPKGAKFPFNWQQNEAIGIVIDWFHSWQAGNRRKQCFFLAGFAGTGKTSVALTISTLCVPPHRVVYIAPTGKAASRLRQKGCANAKTIHQLIYNVRGEDDDGEPIFIGKGSIDERPLLIIMDEASMVGEYDLEKLLQHGVPVLALGDWGQVKPVKAVAHFTKERADYTLTEIERTDKDSNIVRGSMFVREGKRLPLVEYADVQVRDGMPTDAELIAHSGEDSQIICAFNKTRTAINARVRKLLGYEGHLPAIGEKILCKCNQHGHGFMNGEQGIVLEYLELADYEREDDDETGIMVKLRSLTDGKTITVKFNPMSFSTDELTRNIAYKSQGGFDYGHCLTIHASQGSEWDNVLVIEEAIRGSYAESIYTAITRAIKNMLMRRA